MSSDILIVDDEADIRALIAGVLEDEGYVPREAGGADAALKDLRLRQPSLVILDIWMEGSRLDGLELLRLIRTEQPDLPVVMISGHGTIETAVRAIKEGAYDFIEKPFKADRLLLIVERAIQSARLRRELDDLRSRVGEPEDLIGNSSVNNQVRQSIGKVAPTGSRVLISGPPGVGKEVAARRIHALSRRADGPFVCLNCATVAPDRFEAELFGVERAPEDHGRPREIGIFERAHGGTLLLDEVGDMPLDTQGKIVRVLLDQSFVRVGGVIPIKVDVRVLASTNRELEVLIGDGRFRRDLYDRLNVVPIEIPPLRQRREDIAPLAEHLMRMAAESNGLPPRPIGSDALAALQAYEWPGNVRQLRNVVDWLLIMAPGEPGDPVKADMLPPEVGSITPSVLRWDGNTEMMALPLREAREFFEREYLLAQVTRFGGNISRTAAFVGMERSALHRKLKSLGVHQQDRGQKYGTD